jgi:hypothetical protein
MQRQRQILSCVLAAGLLAASLVLAQTPQSAPASQATQATPTPPNAPPQQTPPVAQSPYSDEAENLNKLALELKQAVEKSNRDQLSLMVVRKADAIEKLAHSLKLKVKGAGGAE